MLAVDDLPGEEWRPVVGFEELYDVSNMGRVRRMAGGTTYIGRIIKPVLQKTTGRVLVTLTRDGIKHPLQPSRLVAFAFLPPPSEGQWQVNHIDGDPSHNRRDNLEWCTPSENAKHAYRLKKGAAA